MSRATIFGSFSFRNMFKTVQRSTKINLARYQIAVGKVRLASDSPSDWQLFVDTERFAGEAVLALHWVLAFQWHAAHYMSLAVDPRDKRALSRPLSTLVSSTELLCARVLATNFFPSGSEMSEKEWASGWFRPQFWCRFQNLLLLRACLINTKVTNGSSDSLISQTGMGGPGMFRPLISPSRWTLKSSGTDTVCCIQIPSSKWCVQIQTPRGRLEVRGTFSTFPTVFVCSAKSSVHVGS